MAFDKDTDLSKTGYIKIAREKPVRPINLTWLNVFGAMNIIFSLVCVAAAYAQNFVSAGCAAAPDYWSPGAAWLFSGRPFVR